jgi:transposase
MALTLEPQLRQEIERRRRHTHDNRIAQRLSAVLWVGDGKTQQEVAALLGVTERQVRKWLRLYRTKGLEALCTLLHQGGPGKLRAAQIERLKTEIATGHFLTAQQIADWIDEAFHIRYTPRGVRDLLHRIGVSYHKTTGFFWKANPAKQEEFINTYEQQKVEADSPKTRRYFVDACHPVNILGAYCPDDHEYLDLRLSRDNINAQQFVNLLRLLRASHPETERFLLYLDNAKYYHAEVVQEYVARHPEFHLEFLPAYSPNLNLIERLWKFLRKKAFTRWHKTFEDLVAAVSAVLDHLEDYRAELTTLMVEKFQRHPQAKVTAEQSVAA